MSAIAYDEREHHRTRGERSGDAMREQFPSMKRAGTGGGEDDDEIAQPQ